MLFTSEFNQVMWYIKRKLGVSQKVAYQFAKQALKFGYDLRLISNASVFNTWSQSNARAVAGHLWGLHKAYKETGDTGRSIAFYRASSALYKLLENGNVSPAQYHAQKFVGESITSEVIDYYLSAHTTGYTARTASIIEAGANDYAQRVHRAYWSY